MVGVFAAISSGGSVRKTDCLVGLMGVQGEVDEHRT